MDYQLTVQQRYTPVYLLDIVVDPVSHFLFEILIFLGSGRFTRCNTRYFCKMQLFFQHSNSLQLLAGFLLLQLQLFFQQGIISLLLLQLFQQQYQLIFNALYVLL